MVCSAKQHLRDRLELLTRLMALALAVLSCSPAVAQLITSAESVSAAPATDTTQSAAELRLLDLSEKELRKSGILLSSSTSQLTQSSEEAIIELQIPEETLPKIETDSDVGFGDWLGYNSTHSDWTWVAAGNDLGMFSMQSYPALALSQQSGITTGLGVHFLSGPSHTDLPPRLFDFELAYQTREIRTNHWMLDLKLGVGAFSDFEGSARKGIRFPGHAVSYYEVDRWLVTVLGVDVLDRDDISLLPVVGAVWRVHDALLLEAVFPKPRVQWQINQNHIIYAGAELGGGTWAVERTDFSDDNATYRDIRLAVGYLRAKRAGESVLEFGYAFDRDLEYRSGRGNYEPDNAWMLRLRAHY